jgi:hypothetical protein
MDLVDRAKKTVDVLLQLSKHGNEIKKRLRELWEALEHTITSIDMPWAIKAEVPVEPRSYKRLEVAPLRCEESGKELSQVVVEGPMLKLICGNEECWRVDLREITPDKVLTLACNLEPEEVAKLEEIIKEKIGELNNDLSSVKELIAYAKLLLS